MPSPMSLLVLRSPKIPALAIDRSQIVLLERRLAGTERSHSIDRSQIALLERRLADDERANALFVHQQSVEIDQLTDEIHRLRVVLFLFSLKNKHSVFC